jgi:hypothetical protein
MRSVSKVKPSCLSAALKVYDRGARIIKVLVGKRVSVL